MKDVSLENNMKFTKENYGRAFDTKVCTVIY